ncbi:hypothetical protein KY338_01160 [Candidatus Woesearchaeota archaeon]|nr:hypothetical protein [Candidatus Woesearchaeota archaeon]MBW3006017.1 hypothetical protein [Candidatus Woesearchaeota archaeon]
MKKIIFCLIIALFLTSCGLVQQKKEEIKIPGVHEGTKGIVLEFLTNSPPAEIYEERVFQILVDVQNKGAADVSNGMLVLGTEEQQISIESEKDTRFDLDGKSVFNPEGSKDIKEFRAKSKLLITGIESHETAITATACYPYKTEATALVCIDTDLAGMVKTKPCKTQRISMAGGQGAPVAITSVEPKMMTHEDIEKIQPEFLIKVQNLGAGQALLKEKTYDACTGKALGSETWNRVQVRATLSETPLTCKPETVKLSGDTTVLCVLEQGIEKTKGTYTAPLSIEVEYGYLDRAVKKVNIKKLSSK